MIIVISLSDDLESVNIPCGSGKYRIVDKPEPKSHWL